ncbi:TetR family transcriptional regulator [Allosaccharopolyspora coralli]|uniref:TetR family transcriptional regulator n=1 Tax=Allosaccharopolyspora coralli TaxID=2665642 RepID=A0A5Q3QJ24_9PSEU|nr:TetR/AcrR family transcriptional regulator [Allosaccharopolyspora coralli]QGK70847.1 TetR family transcriptional regulator [Allosaccharopolyspora coralli]
MARRYHHGDLRTALLEHAERTVAEDGVDALSLRELARDAGVSHAAPRRHFRDRNDLLDALALTGFERLGAALRAVRVDGSFTDQLAMFAEAYVRFSVANPELLHLMWARKHARDDVGAAAREACAAPIAIIVDARAQGQVVDGDVERIGLSVFALVHGIAGLAAGGVLPEDQVPDAIATGVADLVDGLRPRE